MSQEVAPRAAGTPLKNKVKDLLPTSAWRNKQIAKENKDKRISSKVSERRLLINANQVSAVRFLPHMFPF
jgi:hypothetical protein